MRDCEKHSQDKGRPKQNEKEVRSLVAAILAAIIFSVAALAIAGALFVIVLQASKAAQMKWQLQSLLSVTVIALSNNVDNLSVRLAYSIQGTKVPLSINVWISIITLMVSSCAAYSGVVVVSFLGARFATWLSMTMLLILGFTMIVQARIGGWHNQICEEKTDVQHVGILRKAHHADIDDSKRIHFVEGTILGVALSINNIGGGITAGAIGIAPSLVGFLSALISFAALLAGNHAAEFFIKKHITDKAALVGGAALILIGLKQIF